MRAARGRRAILISALLLAAAVVVSVGVGAVWIPPGDVVRIILSRAPGVTLTPTWPETWGAILWNVRLPRVAMGALVGMGLAVAGTAYQGMFKNPLADPGVLGVSAGAAVGGATAIAFLDRLHIGWLGTVPVFAFLGGLLAVALVYRLAAVGRRVPVVALLLAGVAVGSLCISLVSLIMFLTTVQAREAITFWMMGALGGANWEKVSLLLPYMAAGVGLLVLHGRDLNALLLGEESALHLGVEVERLKKVIMVAGSLLTAAAVAFCGTIGFVGLVVPHVVRLLVGPDHRYLLPAAGLTGAAFLVAADTLARSIAGASEVPVGLVMAILGGPFFLWLLRNKLYPAGV